MDNLELWDKIKDVPASAQKKIGGGRLKGMTDISPQWRYHKMTEIFGPIGIGWKFTIDRQWIEPGSENQACAMTNISLYYKNEGEWSQAIPGTGGSMLINKEIAGPYTSDEAFKMSLTDALSVAMKMLGVGAIIYSAGNDYIKYSAPGQETQTKDQQTFLMVKNEIRNAQNLHNLDEIIKKRKGMIEALPPAGKDELYRYYENRVLVGFET